MEHSPLNQTGNEPVTFRNCSKNRSTDIQDSEQHATAAFTGDTTTPPLTITTPLIEVRLVREEQTNEFHLPLTSTVVLKRKQEMLYVPVDFENNRTVHALVDSRAYFSAIDQNDLDTIKQNAPHNILKIDDPLNCQIQVANGKLEKSLARAAYKFENRNNNFTEHFVVMKKLTGPIIGFLFQRNSSVVIDTTHGLIHFSHLTMQVKTASSQTTAKLQPVITNDAPNDTTQDNENNHSLC